MRALRHLYLLFLYYLSWLVFGFVGLMLNLACAPLLLAPRRERLGSSVRKVIRALFSFWVKWNHATGVVSVYWVGFDRPLEARAVYVANHPTLVDATFLLARLPDAICIFKPALLRNPAIGPAAILAGYAAGDAGIDLIRDAADKVAAGRSLLVFPEGTRTSPGARLNPLKPGFALIAQRAEAPIRLIVVRCSRHLVPRGRAWWRPCSFPAWIEFRLAEEIPPNSGHSVAEITARVEQALASAVEPLPAPV